jgi:hypothetical protein
MALEGKDEKRKPLNYSSRLGIRPQMILKNSHQHIIERDIRKPSSS